MASDSDSFNDFEDEGDSLSLPAQLRDPIGVFRRQRRWILVSLIPLLLATGAAASLFKLKYESRATILLTAKRIPDEYVPTTIVDGIVEQFDAIRGEVFSRNGLSEIISETGLYREDVDKVPREVLAARLNKQVTVQPVSGGRGFRGSPRSVAFEVKMSGHDPEQITRVVNTIVGKLIDENIEYRSRQARVTTQFMQREFDRADEALRAHQRELARFRADNRGALPEEQQTSLSKLERLEEQRRSAILRISDYQMSLERIESKSRELDGESIASLRARVENARLLYTPDHPTLRSLERQLASIESSAGSSGSSGPGSTDEGARILKGIQSEQRRLEEIDQSVKQVEAQLALAPEIAESYAAFVRKEAILQENYVEYLRKLKNAELALSLESSQQGAQLNRLDPAIAPTSPVIPRWMIAVAGAIVSFGLAILIGIAHELLMPVIIDEQHLEDVLSIPCLGSIAETASR